MAHKKTSWFILNERFNEFQIMNEVQRAKIVLKILNKKIHKIFKNNEILIKFTFFGSLNTFQNLVLMDN